MRGTTAWPRQLQASTRRRRSRSYRSGMRNTGPSTRTWRGSAAASSCSTSRGWPGSSTSKWTPPTTPSGAELLFLQLFIGGIEGTGVSLENRGNDCVCLLDHGVSPCDSMGQLKESTNKTASSQRVQRRDFKARLCAGTCLGKWTRVLSGACCVASAIEDGRR